MEFPDQRLNFWHGTGLAQPPLVTILLHPMAGIAGNRELSEVTLTKTIGRGPRVALLAAGHVEPARGGPLFLGHRGRRLARQHA